MVAAIGDTPYNIVLLVHLFSVVLGVGTAFAAPVMAVQSRREGGQLAQQSATITANTLIFPMLFVAGMAGGALVGMSQKVWEFSQLWLAIAGPLWMATLALALAAYPPRWLHLFNLSDERKRMAAGLLHLSLAAMMVIMVWRFGAG